MSIGSKMADKADEAVIGKARDEAVVALRLGHTVFAPVLLMPGGALSIGLALNRWGMVVATIEAEGWRLEHWAANGSTACPLFRRVNS